MSSATLCFTVTSPLWWRAWSLCQSALYLQQPLPWDVCVSGSSFCSPDVSVVFPEQSLVTDPSILSLIALLVQSWLSSLCWKNVNLFLTCAEDSAPCELSGWSTFNARDALGFVTAACAVPTLVPKSWHFQMRISLAGEQGWSRSLYFSPLWGWIQSVGWAQLRKWLFRSPEMLHAEYNHLKNSQ